MFRTSEIAVVEVPEFQELSVKNLWESWKDNEAIKEYIPDYTDSELPEREFLFGIVGILYNAELTDVVRKSYSHRKQKYKKDDGEAIVITNEMSQLIKAIDSYKSKFCID